MAAVAPKKGPFDATKIDLTTGENVVCSLIASCVAEASTYPVEVAKVRLQIQGASAPQPNQTVYKGLFDAMFKVGRNEGLTKLFAGLPAGVVRHSIAGNVHNLSPDELPCVFDLILCCLYGDNSHPCHHRWSIYMARACFTQYVSRRPSSHRLTILVRYFKIRII